MGSKPVSHTPACLLLHFLPPGSRFDFLRDRFLVSIHFITAAGNPKTHRKQVAGSGINDAWGHSISPGWIMLYIDVPIFKRQKWDCQIQRQLEDQAHLPTKGNLKRVLSWDPRTEHITLSKACHTHTHEVFTGTGKIWMKPAGHGIVDCCHGINANFPNFDHYI